LIDSRESPILLGSSKTFNPKDIFPTMLQYHDLKAQGGSLLKDFESLWGRL
jgi:hypothetical protein